VTVSRELLLSVLVCCHVFVIIYVTIKIVHNNDTRRGVTALSWAKPKMEFAVEDDGFA
jgi:hypothetical protein